MTDLAAERSAEQAADLVLGGRYHLHPARFVPDLAAPGVEACDVTDQAGGASDLYALLVRPGLPSRLDLMAELIKLPVAGIVAPLDRAVVDLAPGDARLAIVYERPTGGRLWAAPGAGPGAAPVPEHELQQTILPPLIEALGQLAQRDLTHRAIRPDNIHYRTADKSDLILGECCARPAGADQPWVYEPLASALAPAEGRGDLTPASDLYALGVTVLALASGRDPAAGRDALTLAAAKIVHGSYDALVGKRRFGSAIRSLLIGLLADDPARRWTNDTLRAWCDGHWDANVTVVPGVRRVPRYFRFQGQDYFHAPVLAIALARRPREAVRAIHDPRLESWVRGSLADSGAADRIKSLVTAARPSDKPGRSDRPDRGDRSRHQSEAEIVARVCRELDPDAPLRYRDLVLTKDGLAPILADAFGRDDRGRLKTLAELIQGGLFMDWLGGDGAPAHLSSLRHFVAQAQVLGNGLERCLYEMDFGVPCLSPLVRGACVMTPADLPGALDLACQGGGDPRTLIDRHVAAFLASRQSRYERPLAAIGRAAGDRGRAALAELKLLAELQRTLAPAPLHGLTAFAARHLEPLVAEFHSAFRREFLSRKMEKLARSGDLTALLSGLDLAAGLERDRAEYRQAVRQHAHLDREIDRIDTGETVRLAAAQQAGQWLASILSILVLLISGATVLMGAVP